MSNHTDGLEICPRCGRSHGADAIINEHLDELLMKDESPTPANSPAEPSLDEILNAFGRWMTDCYTQSHGLPAVPGISKTSMKPSEAKAALLQWKQRAVAAELNRLKVYARQSNRTVGDIIRTIDSFQDNLIQLTAQPGTGGDNNE